MRKQICLILLPVLLASLLAGCGDIMEAETGEDIVYVYNWGDYVDPDVLDSFTEETGIQVILDEFDTNEDMYPKIASGASKYDVICPSDYMINKMIQNDLLQPLDFDQLPLAKQYIGQEYWDQAEAFDPGNAYAVPYCWGTVGIMYNTTMISEPVESWDILWDPKYKDDILMQDSVRDAFMVALRRLGYSLNTTDPAQLEEA
ncbi:MAG: extracellular solute-binding protein, partial [Eubacterium sp.]|nr:extracellular solute-binding protein [Eubacterium sp.]